MKITNVEAFTVTVPVSEEDKRFHKAYSEGVVRLSTDEDIAGYGFCYPARGLGDRGRFGLPTVEALEQQIKPRLVGQDPFKIGLFMKQGLLQYGALEHALWDIVGKAAGKPVYRLLGAHKDKVQVYLTLSFNVNGRWSHGTLDYVPSEMAAEAAAHYLKHGFKGVKIRFYHAPGNGLDNVRAMKEAVGDKMHIFVDKTGKFYSPLWDYQTGLDAARQLEKLGATWLEEPFDRWDAETHARLRKEVDILITGGEFLTVENFREFAAKESFDIFQPHCMEPILTLRKIGMLGEVFGVDCNPHGSHGLQLAAGLQADAAAPNCWIQEIVFTCYPLLPQEQWEPLNVLTKNRSLYKVEDGCIVMSDAPGLGVEVDEDAINQYRVEEA
ncbi:MAG: mandelate racemase/muconate lactonizing enzyme family protein [Candidatus Bathyarchaeia archaeon]